MDPSTRPTDIASPTQHARSREPPRSRRPRPAACRASPTPTRCCTSRSSSRSSSGRGSWSATSPSCPSPVTTSPRTSVASRSWSCAATTASCGRCRTSAGTGHRRSSRAPGQTRSVMRCPVPRVDLRARRPAGGGAVRPGVRLPRPRPGGPAAVPDRRRRWPGVLLHSTPTRCRWRTCSARSGPYLEWLNVAGLQVHRRPRGRPVDRGLRRELEDPGRQLLRGLPRPGGPSDARPADRRQGDHRRQQRLVRVVAGALPHAAFA